MKRPLSMILPLAVLGLFAFGQNQDIVTVKVIPVLETLKPGQAYPLTLEVAVRAPYHINSDQPLDDFLIGTTVDFKPEPGLTYKKVTFPPAEMRKLELSDKPMAIYEGTIKITAELVLAPDFKGRQATIAGTLGYQACDDRSCLPPASVSFNRKVAIAGTAEMGPAGARIKESAPPTAGGAPGFARGSTSAVLARGYKPRASGEPKARPLTSAPVVESKTETPAGERTQADPSAAQKEKAAGSSQGANPFENKGLFLTFILVFFGGLALNLTPCIYPLIPITISYFGGQSQSKKGGVVAHAVLYVVGMAMTYSILGVIAAFTGSLFGAALQYPLVLIGIALVMVLLALSMFNVYELRIPAFLNKFAGGSQKGFFGTFFMGLTCGIIAAPCIGPFVLGLLTYVGDRGNVLLGFSLFFVLALGLGVPFLFLGIFSGSLKRIPRSGAWMVWVRTIFGFILIAMAIYFLKTLFPNALFYNLALALTLAVAGVYMAWIEPTKTAGKVFPYIRNIFGVIFFVLALYTAATGIQGYLDDEIATQLQSLSSAKGALVPGDAVSWQVYSEEKLAGAVRDGKPVFIDFFTDWCLECKEMDRLTFSDPGVVAVSRNFVMLRSNLTRDTDPALKDLYKKYQVRGFPTYVFLGADGKETTEIRLVGFEKKQDFVSRLKRALELGGK